MGAKLLNYKTLRMQGRCKFFLYALFLFFSPVACPSEGNPYLCSAMLKKLPRRIWILGTLLAGITLVQHVPGWGDGYTQYVYPAVARLLGRISQLIPFAVGDLFIALAVGWLVTCPFYLKLRKGRSWKGILLHEAEFLLWIYAWFYLAWGLNYAQSDFYGRTGIARVDYSEAGFKAFAYRYVDEMNGAYADIAPTSPNQVADKVAQSYRLPQGLPGMHPLFLSCPKAKTMLFTPLASMVGVTGSMGPFFCEFTLNGDVLPPYYPATFAHELAHFQGTAREAEANLYSYLACTRSDASDVRFSGYLSILPHVLSNASRLMEEEAYADLYRQIRPEIMALTRRNQQYWAEKYSPLIGRLQNILYDLYLKGNNIPSGRKNYSEVIGLLISCQEWEKHHPAYQD